jgi:phosphohistidine phosphatase
MNLIIVRHAAAVDRTRDCSEENRYLTPEGRAYFRKTAHTVQRKGIAPSLILTSPLVRAVQTAEILAETIAYAGPLQVVDMLASEFSVPDLARLFAEYPPQREVVLVGHEPDLSALVVSLLALRSGFPFNKGAAVKLKVDPDDLKKTAVFKWLAAGKKLLTEMDEALAVERG